MYFYIIQLFDQRYKDDIMLALTTAGMMHGTCIEGENYDNILDNNFPIFTGFFKTKDLKERASTLFFGIEEDIEKIKNVKEVLEDAGVSNKDDEIYRIVSIPGDKI